MNSDHSFGDKAGEGSNREDVEGWSAYTAWRETIHKPRSRRVADPMPLQMDIPTIKRWLLTRRPIREQKPA